VVHPRRGTLWLCFALLSVWALWLAIPSDVLEAFLHPARLKHAKEAALKDALFTFRQSIDQFYADKGRYPTSLEELRKAHYIRKLPVDPFTRSSDTWLVEREEPPGTASGVINVYSGSNATATDGTTYSCW